VSCRTAERIELLRHTRAQTGQLFMLYDDALRKIEHWLEKIARTNQPTEMRDERAAAKSPDFYPKLLSGETIFRIEAHVEDPK